VTLEQLRTFVVETLSLPGGTPVAIMGEDGIVYEASDVPLHVTSDDEGFHVDRDTVIIAQGEELK
jgi:hypothetical protein